MSEWMFRWLMQGKTVEEIAESMTAPKMSPEEIRKAIIKDQEKFEEVCLQSVFRNAKKGDVTAIDWLTKRGLFTSIKLPE